MLNPIVKKLVGLVLVLVVTSYTILGFWQLYQKIDTSILSKKISESPCFATFNFNKLSDKFEPEFIKNKKTNVPSPKKKSNKNILENLLLINTFNTSTDGILMLFTITFLSSMLFIKKTWKNINTKSSRKPPDIVFYKNWILKFLTPMEKCLHSRADEYDINPINNVFCREKARTLDKFKYIPSAGFLIGISK